MSEINKILNQDILNKELHYNNGLNTWRVFANRGEYGTIENIYKMPDTKIQNNDVDKLKINNINYPEGESETIEIRDNVGIIYVNDSSFPILEINDNRDLAILELRNVNLTTLNIHNSLIGSIFLYNCNIDRLYVANSVTIDGILMNHNTKLDNLKLRYSIISNTFKNNYNDIYNEKIKTADDIIIDEPLTESTRYSIDMRYSRIIENNDCGCVYINKKQKQTIFGRY